MDWKILELNEGLKSTHGRAGNTSTRQNQNKERVTTHGPQGLKGDKTDKDSPRETMDSRQPQKIKRYELLLETIICGSIAKKEKRKQKRAGQ
jgi:hypothetical protein